MLLIAGVTFISSWIIYFKCFVYYFHDTENVKNSYQNFDFDDVKKSPGTVFFPSSFRTPQNFSCILITVKSYKIKKNGAQFYFIYQSLWLNQTLSCRIFDLLFNVQNIVTYSTHRSIFRNKVSNLTQNGQNYIYIYIPRVPEKAGPKIYIIYILQLIHIYFSCLT